MLSLVCRIQRSNDGKVRESNHGTCRPSVAQSLRLEGTELLEKLMKELVCVAQPFGRAVDRTIAPSGSRCIIGMRCQSEPQCKHSSLSTQHSVTVLDRSGRLRLRKSFDNFQATGIVGETLTLDVQTVIMAN